MDFKHIKDKHATPQSKIGMLGRRLSQGIVSESPFRSMPDFSTPPSRFTKIINPFEPHMIERLHLPTFSPNVFLQNSTPRQEEKFKWTIEDISALKPADIDESTVSQHVHHPDDPHIESIVQEKIQTYFSKSHIVPSPMGISANKTSILKESVNHLQSIEETPTKPAPRNTCDGSTQTMLSLPPILPKELEEALKPYFNDQPEHTDETYMDGSLYKQLFESHHSDVASSAKSRDGIRSLSSSPPASLGISPVHLSPYSRPLHSPFDMPELNNCTLSPITKSGSKKSPISNLFSDMSVDASLIVPDVDQEEQKSCTQTDYGSSPLRNQLKNSYGMGVSSSNLSMEYRQFSIEVSTNIDTNNTMDISNSTTPHSKIFVGRGQRKRLSDSFKNDDNQLGDNAVQSEDISMKSRSKISRNNDATDGGYFTQDTNDFTNNSSVVFASTPSKRNMKLEFEL